MWRAAGRRSAAEARGRLQHLVPHAQRSRPTLDIRTPARLHTDTRRESCPCCGQKWRCALGGGGLLDARCRLDNMHAQMLTDRSTCGLVAMTSA